VSCSKYTLPHFLKGKLFFTEENLTSYYESITVFFMLNKVVNIETVVLYMANTPVDGVRHALA
jgi:hypothetical protein